MRTLMVIILTRYKLDYDNVINDNKVMVAAEV
jgi:hypothetical protein